MRSEIKLDIIGVGSPIVDMLVQVEDEVIEIIGGQKGGMELVDAAIMEKLMSHVGSNYNQAPGGSAANTIFAITKLGSTSSFLGKLGNDVYGTFYSEAFNKMGCDGSRFKYCTSNPTARCLSLITPDSERTMRTSLGAAAGLLPDEISDEDFHGSRHVHVEGYLLFNRELLVKVLESARSMGCTISLDLGSFEVVKAAGDILPDLLEKYVDIIFANEDEAEAYTGTADPDEALDILSGVCETAVVKLGKEGVLVKRGDEIHHVPAIKVDNAVDTTGAGDYWAAGFLFGYIRGYPLDVSANIGVILGAEVVQHVGAGLPEESWGKVLAEIQKIEKTHR